MEINCERKNGIQDNPGMWGWGIILGNVESWELQGIHGNKPGDKKREAGAENWESGPRGNEVGQEEGKAGFSRDVGMGIIPGNGHSKEAPALPGRNGSSRIQRPARLLPIPAYFYPGIFLSLARSCCRGSRSQIHPRIIPGSFHGSGSIPGSSQALPTDPDPSQDYSMDPDPP